MARRLKNSGCVYTGLVGAKMRPRSGKRKQPGILYDVVRCLDGPLMGRTIRVERQTGGTTLQFTLRGATGFYRGGCWVKAE